MSKPVLCRLLGHRWENVRAWSTRDNDAAWFCRRCSDGPHPALPAIRAFRPERGNA